MGSLELPHACYRFLCNNLMKFNKSVTVQPYVGDCDTMSTTTFTKDSFDGINTAPAANENDDDEFTSSDRYLVTDTIKYKLTGKLLKTPDGRVS